MSSVKGGKRRSGGVGIALFSYCGVLGFGFNADREIVPDLDVFAAAVRRGFDELVQAAQIA